MTMKNNDTFFVKFYDFLDPTLEEKVFASLKTQAKTLGIMLTRTNEKTSGTFHICSSPFFLSEKYQRFDWNYLFQFASFRTQSPKYWRFFVYSERGEFFPGRNGKVKGLSSTSDTSELWADGAVSSGLSFTSSFSSVESLESSDFAWLPLLNRPAEARPALFLDRDGILNRDRGHVHRIKDLEWKEEIFELLSLAQSRGHQLVVLTNQSGMARGYYNEKDMNSLHQHMQEVLQERAEVTIDGWYHCPFHPQGQIEGLNRLSLMRKPMAGMPLKAAFEKNVDLSHSLMLGDKLTDRFQALDLETYLLAGDYFELSQADAYYDNHDWDNQASYFCFEDFQEMIEVLKKRIRRENL